jgi:hypothetical protein
MTFGSDTRKSKYKLNEMVVGEIFVFIAPDTYSKSLIRRSAHNQNRRSERYYITRSDGNTIRVTRVR